jgi:hypothetical protein
VGLNRGHFVIGARVQRGGGPRHSLRRRRRELENPRRESVRRHGIRVVAGAEPAGVRGNEQCQCASRTVGNGAMAGPWIAGESRQEDR